MDRAYHVENELDLTHLKTFINALDNQIERVIVNPLASDRKGAEELVAYGFRQTGVSHDRLLFEITVRRAVRGVIFNPQGELLLMKMKADHSKEDQRTLATFWLTPGGKVEGDEGEEEALRREIFEETGLKEIEIGPEIFLHQRSDVWDNIPMRLFNRYYLVKSNGEGVNHNGLMEDEKEIVLGSRWWNLQELSTTQEAVFPVDLIDKIKELKNERVQ